MNKLKPCPFCGSPASIEEVKSVGAIRKSAGCNTEHCQGYQSQVTFSTYKEAEKAWNTRTKPQPKETHEQRT